ncbi:NIPSNAP family protein [Streptomyces griseus]|uniref:NIPSNAP family protein n=1 Tax=Streptomyces griseus TaxID=1911 RepID=UPI0020C82F3B|nr:NIPSNAP family protein [Streptomyces griseus]
MARTTQVRTYTVREGLLDEWAQRWKAEILPLRLEWGFAIGGAWVDREHNQFVWLISYEGPETFAERNAMYWDSPARKSMDLDPAVEGRGTPAGRPCDAAVQLRHHTRRRAPAYRPGTVPSPACG